MLHLKNSKRKEEMKSIEFGMKIKVYIFLKYIYEFINIEKKFVQIYWLVNVDNTVI